MVSVGNTIDFMLSAKRDRRAAKRFFRKALATHNQIPLVLNLDKNERLPTAVDELKAIDTPQSKDTGILGSTSLHSPAGFLQLN